MELNNDCIAILNFMAEYDNEYVKLSELSDQFKVTEKTIRNKLGKIEDFLKTKGFEALDRKYGEGIRLNATPELMTYLEKYKKTYTPYQYVFSSDERKRFIQSELLQSEEPINISYFMSVMDISKNTVIKELNEIESVFAQFNLKLRRKPRVGIYVEGKEKDKRLALSRVNSEIMTVSDLLNFISTGEGNSKSNTLQFETLFSDIDTDFLDRLLIEIEQDSEIEFSDTAYSSMITHLVIMIKRIQTDRRILAIDAPIDERMYAYEINLAKKMVAKIEKHFDIEIPETEVNYIVLHLIGAKLTKGPGISSSEEESLRNVIKSMISAIESIYGVAFSQREALLDGLLLHLRPAVNRIRFNLKIENPLYEDILIQYRELFENTRKVCVLLEEYLGKTISAHEISYIMLHFGAALQNSTESEAPYRVILVCGTGVGTANMLKSQLNEVYQMNVVDTLGARSVREYPRDKYELIISTIPIPQMDPSEYIRINPLLMKNDYERLDKLFQKRKNLFASKEMVSIDDVMEIVGKYAKVENEDQLKLELLMILADRVTSKDSKEGAPLREYLKESSIKVSVPVKNWEHAVEEACAVLEDRRSILPSYCASIKEKLRTLGPYMVIAPGVALLHTDTDKGVLKTDFSIMTLRQGIRFGKEDYDPVRLVITFSSTDGVSHIQALRDLALLLGDSERVLKIMNADTKKEIQKLI